MNYGRSGEMLVAAGRGAELAGVMGRMLNEAQRASEVVRRLRDFFRTGTTRLEQVPLLELLERASRAGESLPDARGISFKVEVEAVLHDILVDRLQMELVLRTVERSMRSIERTASSGSFCHTEPGMSESAGRQLVVYIVDDDASIRDSLALMLGLAGYSTRLYADAESFLVAFDEEWRGCVIADLCPPRARRFEGRRWISSKSPSRTPISAMPSKRRSHSNDEVWRRPRRAGQTPTGSES